LPDRVIRVYRLDVTYPPGSQEPGWEPDGWEPEVVYSYEGPDTLPFKWPRNQLCLSKTTAERRAALFRSYGAEVVIRPSAPVEWPAPEEPDNA
jgi:hypothetical protein